MQAKERVKALLRRFPRAHAALKSGRDAFRSLTTLAERVPSRRIGVTKEAFSAAARMALQEFLASGQRLTFEPVRNPQISVVIVVYNRAELTFLCLSSLLEHQDVGLEIIVVDNASSDETAALLGKVTGIKHVHNDSNLHFLLGSNQGAAQASGRHLLFLNNDTQVTPGSIRAALATLESSPNIGAVGAKLVLPDGSLQEAGSIVWNDGTALGYGRGDNPDAAPYMFRRDVDYCSGAFLLTPRNIFERLNRFDVDYAPAYYEEVDYCLRLWENNLRVVYEPCAVIQHFEFASSRSSEDALALQRRNKEIFCRKRSNYLRSRLSPSPAQVLEARIAGSRRKRLLFIDERLPHRFYGTGYPRAYEIVRSAAKLGWQVTHFPAVFVEPEESWNRIYQELPREIEVMALGDSGPRSLEKFLLQRQGYYDCVMVSRPTTLAALKKLRTRNCEIFGRAKLVYDAEAIFTLRDELYAKLMGNPLSEAEVAAKISQEFADAKGISHITTVSPAEAKHFQAAGFPSVHVLSHQVEVVPTSRDFAARSGLLFVGAIHYDHGPNPDALFWFLDQIFPRILQSSPGLTLRVAGFNQSERLKSYQNPQVQVLGQVGDLRPLYDAARVFIAPTRFSAGIPLKIIEASANGLPTVGTELLRAQLGWVNGQEMLAAADAESFSKCCLDLYHSRDTWEKVRAQVLVRVKNDYGPEAFERSLSAVLGQD